MSSLPKMPAYQEYPADILNNEVFMQLSMAQRGLLWTLRMYCWKNETIPGGFKALANLVGISENEAIKLFDDKVQSFFACQYDSTGDRMTGRLFNKDLEAYRKEKLAAREKRSSSGKLGADKRWRLNSNGDAITDGMAKEMRRVELDNEYDNAYEKDHDFDREWNMKRYVMKVA